MGGAFHPFTLSPCHLVKSAAWPEPPIVAADLEEVMNSRGKRNEEPWWCMRLARSLRRGGSRFLHQGMVRTYHTSRSPHFLLCALEPVMRVAVLILAILGSLSAGFLGYRWKTDADTVMPTIEAVRALAADDPTAQAKIQEVDRLVIATWCLLGAVGVGLVAGFVGFYGQGLIAAALLAAAVIVPAIFEPRTLVFTSPLALAAILALFIRKPRPAPSPTKDAEPAPQTARV